MKTSKSEYICTEAAGIFYNYGDAYEQEIKRQQHRQELRQFRWTEIIKPMAEQFKQEMLDERPFLKDDKAWELAKDKAWARYNSERKAKRLGITFK